MTLSLRNTRQRKLQGERNELSFGSGEFKEPVAHSGENKQEVFGYTELKLKKILVREFWAPDL